MRDRESRAGFLVCGFVVCFLGLTCFWALLVRPVYYPSGDEFALLVASARMFHPSVQAWFLDGYSHYFLAYPGLSQPQTNFIRPVANMIYWLNSCIFGTRWAWYLLVSYTVQAGLVCVAMKLAGEMFGLGRRLCLVVGALVFVSPAFGVQAMLYPSFAFDLLAALLVLCGAHEIWHRRYGLAWVLFAVAVFTKETALFAPVAAAAMVWLPGERRGELRKRVGSSLVWLVPLLVWVAVRHAAFHGATGVYAFKSLTVREQGLNVLHGVLAWPFGTRGLQQGIRWRFLFFPLNAAAWAACVWLGARAVVRRTGMRIEFRALVVFCLGALAMPVALNLPLRFGASLFPLLSLLLVAGWSLAQDRWVRGTAGVAIAVLFGMALFQKTLEPQSLHEARGEWALARSYVAALGASRADQVLVIDDASGGFTTPELVARFAGYGGVLRRSDNLETLSLQNCGGEPRVKMTGSGKAWQATSEMDGRCGTYAFDGVAPETVTAAPELGVGEGLRVVHPALVPMAPSGAPGMSGELVVEAGPAARNRQVLVPDLGTLRYRELQ